MGASSALLCHVARLTCPGAGPRDAGGPAEDRRITHAQCGCQLEVGAKRGGGRPGQARSLEYLICNS